MKKLELALKKLNARSVNLFKILFFFIFYGFCASISILLIEYTYDFYILETLIF